MAAPGGSISADAAARRGRKVVPDRWEFSNGPASEGGEVAPWRKSSAPQDLRLATAVNLGDATEGDVAGGGGATEPGEEEVGGKSLIGEAELLQFALLLTFSAKGTLHKQRRMKEA
ncbi:hypothetical protein NL676_032047 [Syzygium grande]|nr:hypothetical protein NL676_032047 [Syzygium grande]